MLVNFRIGFILYVFEQILIHICRLVQVFAHISALRASTENPKVSFQVPFPVPVLILQNSGGLAARNKIRDTSEISIKRSVGKKYILFTQGWVGALILLSTFFQIFIS